MLLLQRCSLLLYMVAVLLLCGCDMRCSVAATSDRTQQLRRRLVQRLANRGLPVREQHSRAEELLARLLPNSAQTESPWNRQQSFETTPRINHGVSSPKFLANQRSAPIINPVNDMEKTLENSKQQYFSSSYTSIRDSKTNKDRTLDNSRSHSHNTPEQSQYLSSSSSAMNTITDHSGQQSYITAKQKHYPSPSDNSAMDSQLSSGYTRTARQNPRQWSYQRKNQYSSNNDRQEERTEYPQSSYQQQSMPRERLSNYNSNILPNRNRDELSNYQQHHQSLPITSENSIRGSLLYSGRSHSWSMADRSNMDDLIERNIQEIVQSRMNATSANYNDRSIELNAPLFEDVQEVIRESYDDDRGNLPRSRSETIPNTDVQESESSAESETTTKRPQTREKKRAAIRERRRQREERRKNSKRDRNRRNRNRNRKRDRNKKRGKNKRNKIDELIANESLILHDVDGEPFVDCCPSKLVVVEKQVGKARDKHAVELHPDSKFFYERICLEQFDGAECIFPAKATKSWVQTRCAQTYSFSQALVRLFDSTEDWALDYIEVRSGCSCQVNVTPRNSSSNRNRNSNKGKNNNKNKNNNVDASDDHTNDRNKR